MAQNRRLSTKIAFGFRLMIMIGAVISFTVGSDVGEKDTPTQKKLDNV